MASGILKVPRPHLPEVIKTIRTGLDYRIAQHDLSYYDPVYINLKQWCENMESFLEHYPHDDLPPGAYEELPDVEK